MNLPVDFKAQLTRQLGFIKRSCDGYDEGYPDEGIRIATALRVLFHQTSSSTSLLHHLSATSLNLLSTVEDNKLAMSLGPTFMSGMVLYSFYGSAGSSVGPHLGMSPHFHHFVPLAEWWGQCVMIVRRIPITRGQIVLAAANKDGGAHVDVKHPEAYRTLATPGVVGSYVSGVGDLEVVTPIPNIHLLCLRQMGFEILNSPDLIALAASPEQI